MTESSEQSAAPESDAFALAWSHVDTARQARSVLADAWKELTNRDTFRSSITLESAGSGRLDVSVHWSPEIRAAAETAAQQFGLALRNAFDEAVFATAKSVSGAVQGPSDERHRMPLCYDEAAWLQTLQHDTLAGVRPDQVRLVELFQPYRSPAQQEWTRIRGLRRLMLHLSQLTDPHRDQARPRVAVWAHSAEPLVVAEDPLVLVSVEPSVDGLLEDVKTIARFSVAGPEPALAAGRVRGNPNVAFDWIFNDEPWPLDPDDNLSSRSAALLAATSAFIESLEKSVGLRSPSLTPPPSLPSQAWLPIDVEALAQAQEIRETFAKSDIGLVTYRDKDDGLVMLVESEGTVYRRPIARAMLLDPSTPRGTSAEKAARTAAAIWGLPDFVLMPMSQTKGTGRREIGDGTIVTGTHGLAIQVKSRKAEHRDEGRERSWLLKKANEGARQAAGSVRALRASAAELVNGRGRHIQVRTDVTWAAAVILDHDHPPDGLAKVDEANIPTLVLTRRDWDFLFDQLRSVSAVVDYVHRVAQQEARPVGEEPVRYYELADADERAAAEAPRNWIERLGAERTSYPLLPKAPASSSDATGHAIFRMMLEDIAVSPFDGDEADRLLILARLDRFSVADRANLGRLLLGHLENVAQTPPGMTAWRHRRVIQDEEGLQLAFGACSRFSELHREAFRQWAMLRHHEFSEAGIVLEGATPWTVAVLLTPRFDGTRPWDTTVLAIYGELELSPEELAQMRSLWNSDDEIQRMT